MTNLELLQSMFPGRIALTAEEVAQTLTGRHSKGVVDGVREKMANGTLPAIKTGGGKKGTWAMPVKDLAGILDGASRPSPVEDPIEVALRAPQRGKRHRPLVNPLVIDWVAFWAASMRVVGWTEEAEHLERDLAAMIEQDRDEAVRAERARMQGLYAEATTTRPPRRLTDENETP